MNKKIVWLVFVIVVVIFAGVVFSGKLNSDKSPITLGFVGPLTGGPALWGEGARNMVELAVADINAEGGVDGRQIVVDYQDGKCNPKDAVSSTQQLKASGIKFIVGGHCSPETSGMVPLTKDGSAFMIAGITSSDEAVAGSEFAYRTSPPTVEFAKKLVPIVQSTYQKVATITEVAAFSKSFTDDFAKQFTQAGGEVVMAEEYAPETTDFKTILLKIKATQPEAILISPQNPLTGAQIAKQMSELGISIPVFGNAILVANKTFIASNNAPALVGSFSIIPYTDGTKGAAKTLADHYKGTFGSDVPYNFFYVSASYDAVHMLAQALDKCGEDTACVAKFFQTLTYDGVSADYQFKDNGDSTFATFAKIALDENGKTTITPLQ